jgi:site-specific DNA recombinase
VPAIVSQGDFDRVQAKLALNQQAAPRNNKANQYLMHGLVSCEKCRLSATARTLPTRHQYYVCRGRTDALLIAQERCTARYIPATQLDNLVWQDLCSVITNPDILKYALERAHGGHWLPQELQSQLEALNKASKQMERQQERLLEAYIANVIQLPEFERKRKELTQKQEAIHKQETQLKAASTQMVTLAQVADSIEVFCAKIRPTLEHASFEQKRQLVELLIDRVVVLDGDVEIRYVIPTQPDGPHIPFCQLRSDYRRSLSRFEKLARSGKDDVQKT